MMAPNHILVVDDEVGIRELLLEILADEGYRVLLAENAAQARSLRNQCRPDLVLLDIWMPDTDGITLLKEWAATGLLTMPVVMMSGHGTIDTAVEATRIGAFDFLEKPIALQKLLSTVERALKRGEALPKATGMNLASLGKGPVVAELKKRLEQVARVKAPFLLVGEKGAGAESCARFLHQPNTPWVAPDAFGQLAEAPLDLLEQAREGVLFLGEVERLSRLEQKGLILLLGKLEKFNVRLICSASQPLPDLVDRGAFDESLFQALSGLTLAVPPLRDHREDIPDVAKLMLEELVETRESPSRRFSTAALNVLRNESWPGNLPQLHNTVKTLAQTTLGDEITDQDVSRVLSQFKVAIPAETGTGLPLDLPLREARDEFERVYFDHHLKKSGGNMSRVAEAVGLERTHLYRKLKQLGISPDSQKGTGKVRGD
jgi:two-component system nitrogen regulation response regulator NtrX